METCSSDNAKEKQTQTARSLAENHLPVPVGKEVRVVTLREAKRLISQRLRDPRTDSKSFTHLLVLLAEWHRWKRTPRRKEAAHLGDEDINKLVLELEREQRLKRVRA